MITKVVVCVGDEDREHDPAPQRHHVLHRRSAIPAQHVHEFKVASRLVVLRAEHTHGGEKRLAMPFDAIEARHEEHRLSGDLLETDGWRGDAGFTGERERDRFPRDHVDLVVTARKLRDREAAILQPY